jgi:replicative DNA helicase
MNKEEIIDYGKIPPQSCDLEELVLGCILLESDSLFEVSTILSPEMFYKDAHQRIFSAILKLAEEYKAIDAMTVTELLRSRGELDLVGGPYYITQLTGKVSTSKNIEEYALIINQKYLAREMIRVSYDVSGRSYDDSIDVSDILDYAYLSLDKINNSTLHGRTKTFSENVQNSLNAYEQRVENKKNNIMTFIPTGLGKLNKVLIGWADGLTILAARPSMGKTAIALFFAKEAARNGFPVDIFSLEMSSTKITDRMILGETDIDPQEYKKGLDVDWDQLEKATKKIHDYEIMINDEMDISINYIRSIIRKRHKQGKLGLVIIDYLQLMEGTDKSNKNNEVGSITRALKKLTQKYDFPIILLSQLSRDIEKRGNGRHKLSDLRDSGNIEQDADDVIFISRERYDDEGTELDLSNEDNRRVYIDISKHREGGLGLVTCYCNEYVNRFYEKSYHIEPEYSPDSNIESNKNFKDEEPF